MTTDPNERPVIDMTMGLPIFDAPAHAFPRIDTYEGNERDSENTRVFYGDGSPFLRCPGLLSIVKVRTCGIELPPERIDRILLDASGQNFGFMRVPIVGMIHGADGCPIVRRGTVSNDGNWQDGKEVFITGEWDPEVPATVPEAPKPLEPLPAGAVARRGRPPHSAVQT
jgi:hypothetical protein